MNKWIITNAGKKASFNSNTQSDKSFKLTKLGLTDVKLSENTLGVDTSSFEAAYNITQFAPLPDVNKIRYMVQNYTSDSSLTVNTLILYGRIDDEETDIVYGLYDFSDRDLALQSGTDVNIDISMGLDYAEVDLDPSSAIPNLDDVNYVSEISIEGNTLKVTKNGQTDVISIDLPTYTYDDTEIKGDLSTLKTDVSTLKSKINNNEMGYLVKDNLNVVLEDTSLKIYKEQDDSNPIVVDLASFSNVEDASNFELIEDSGNKSLRYTKINGTDTVDITLGSLLSDYYNKNYINDKLDEKADNAELSKKIGEVTTRLSTLEGRADDSGRASDQAYTGLSNRVDELNTKVSGFDDKIASVQANTVNEVTLADNKLTIVKGHPSDNPATGTKFEVDLSEYVQDLSTYATTEQLEQYVQSSKLTETLRDYQPLFDNDLNATISNMKEDIRSKISEDSLSDYLSTNKYITEDSAKFNEYQTKITDLEELRGLKTTIGNAESGLVKDVNDLKSADKLDTSTFNTFKNEGEFKTLKDKVDALPADIGSYSGKIEEAKELATKANADLATKVKELNTSIDNKISELDLANTYLNKSTYDTFVEGVDGKLADRLSEKVNTSELRNYITTADGDSKYVQKTDEEYTSLKTGLANVDSKIDTKIQELNLGDTYAPKGDFESVKSTVDGLGNVYATKDQVNSVEGTLTNKADKSEIPDLSSINSTLEALPTTYTKQNAFEELQTKVTTNTTDISGLKESVGGIDTKIDSKISELGIENYLTKADAESKFEDKANKTTVDELTTRLKGIKLEDIATNKVDIATLKEGIVDKLTKDQADTYYATIDNVNSKLDKSEATSTYSTKENTVRGLQLDNNTITITKDDGNTETIDLSKYENADLSIYHTKADFAAFKRNHNTLDEAISGFVYETKLADYVANDQFNGKFDSRFTIKTEEVKTELDGKYATKVSLDEKLSTTAAEETYVKKSEQETYNTKVNTLEPIVNANKAKLDNLNVTDINEKVAMVSGKLDASVFNEFKGTYDSLGTALNEKVSESRFNEITSKHTRDIADLAQAIEVERAGDDSEFEIRTSAISKIRTDITELQGNYNGLAGIKDRIGTNETNISDLTTKVNNLPENLNQYDGRITAAQSKADQAYEGLSNKLDTTQYNSDKEGIEASIATKANKSYVDSKLNDYVETNALNTKLDDYVTKTSLTEYATTATVDTKLDKSVYDSFTDGITGTLKSNLDVKANKSYVDDNFVTATNLTTQLDAKVDKATAEATYATKSDVNNSLNTKANKEDVTNLTSVVNVLATDTTGMEAVKAKIDKVDNLVDNNTLTTKLGEKLDKATFDTFRGSNEDFTTALERKAEQTDVNQLTDRMNILETNSSDFQTTIEEDLEDLETIRSNSNEVPALKTKLEGFQTGDKYYTKDEVNTKVDGLSEVYLGKESGLTDAELDGDNLTLTKGDDTQITVSLAKYNTPAPDLSSYATKDYVDGKSGKEAFETFVDGWGGKDLTTILGSYATEANLNEANTKITSLENDKANKSDVVMISGLNNAIDQRVGTYDKDATPAEGTLIYGLYSDLQTLDTSFRDLRSRTDSKINREDAVTNVELGEHGQITITKGNNNSNTIDLSTYVNKAISDADNNPILKLYDPNENGITYVERHDGKHETLDFSEHLVLRTEFTALGNKVDEKINEGKANELINTAITDLDLPSEYAAKDVVEMELITNARLEGDDLLLIKGEESQGNKITTDLSRYAIRETTTNDINNINRRLDEYIAPDNHVLTNDIRRKLNTLQQKIQELSR